MMRQPIRIPFSNPPPITTNTPFSHPLQLNLPGNSQDRFGTATNHANMFSNSSNYYTTLQNSNPIMTKQTENFLENSFSGARINSVATDTSNQEFPRYSMPRTPHSNSAPQLSSLLNMTTGPVDPSLHSLSSPVARTPDSHSNWLNFLHEAELLRSSGMTENAASQNPSQSSNSFPQHQGFSSEQFIPSMSPASVPTGLDLCGTDQTENDIIM